jgi:peptidyl-prolyl cis-trans isomerase SurA
MKIINFIIINIFFIFIINGPTYSSIKNNIIVKVGDEIVTSVELENKIKIILLLSNEVRNQQNINRVKTLALKSLVNLKLKSDELKKYDIQISQTTINQHLERASISLQIKKNDLKNLFIANKINYAQYLEEVEIELMWQKLIMEIYSSKIPVNDDQILKELNEFIKNSEEIKEYHLAEIEINSNNSLEKEELINDIKNNIDLSGFSKTANKFSISPSAIDGGDLGWINSAGLSEKVSKIIKNLKPGNISEPIIRTNTILFLKLIDSRVVKKNANLDLNSLKTTLINNKKTEYFNLYSNNHLSKKRNSTQIEFK